MKRLKFDSSLVGKILSGTKTTTWRLWDDKHLTEGDEVEFIDGGTGKAFAKAKLTDVNEKYFKKLLKEDWEGHERFLSEKKMYETYKKYYGKEVTPETTVKVIRFELI